MLSPGPGRRAATLRGHGVHVARKVQGLEGALVDLVDEDIAALDPADVDVTLLWDIRRNRRDSTAADQLVRRFADRFRTADWPRASRPRAFCDSRAFELDGPAGVLHAKAVVVDDEAVFVTPAHPTEAALDRNIALGLLVRDRALALSVSAHFSALIDQGRLLPLPAR